MAAFTEGAGNFRMRGNENINVLGKLSRDEERRLNRGDDTRASRRLSNATRDIRELVTSGLASMGKGTIKLPHDYQYDNAKPSEELKASTIFGLAVELDENLEETGSRSSYANWVASEANRALLALLSIAFGKKFSV